MSLRITHKEDLDSPSLAIVVERLPTGHITGDDDQTLLFTYSAELEPMAEHPTRLAQVTSFSDLKTCKLSLEGSFL